MSIFWGHFVSCPRNGRKGIEDLIGPEKKIPVFQVTLEKKNRVGRLEKLFFFFFFN